MNPYELLVPQLLAGLVIVVIALRAVRESRRATEDHKQDIAARRAALDRHLAQLDEAAANPSRPASQFVTEWAESALRLTLDLDDPAALADVTQVARETEPLVTGVNRYATTYGTRTFIVTGANAERGRVVLTLTLQGPGGGAGLVQRVADALNAAFEHTRPPNGDPLPDIGTLPPAVRGAHAAASFTT